MNDAAPVAGRRTLPRVLALAVILAAGVVSARRLPLDCVPRWSGDLALRLVVPTSDPGDVARRWVIPLEQRVRGVGGIEGIAGEVTASGADLRLRLRTGADPDATVARLQPQLALAAAELPGASLSLEATAAGPEAPAIVWLRHSAPAAAERLAARLRRLPGVATVTVLGAGVPEVAVELPAGSPRPEPLVARLESSLAAAARERSLGLVRAGDHEWRVLQPATLPPAGSLLALAAAVAAVPVPLAEGAAARLGDVGRVVVRRGEPADAARHDGATTLALRVERDADASLLAVAASVRRQLVATSGARLVWREAEELRTLLLRLGAALAVLTGLAALLGWRHGGGRAGAALALAPSTFAAAVACVWRLSGTRVDVVSLVAGWLALAALLPLATRAVLRARSGLAGALAGTVIAASAVPLVAALAPAALRGFLQQPARTFFLAVLAGAAAAALLPSSRPPRGGGGAIARASLRDAGTTLLLAATAAGVLAAGWGRSLVPRAEAVAPPAADLTATLAVAPETTVAELLPRAAATEGTLRELAGVAETWAFLRSGAARVEARLSPAARRPDSLRRLLSLARAALGSAASVAAPALGGVEVAPADAATALALRPDADKEGHRYQLLLCSADLPALEDAYRRLRERLAGLHVRDSWVSGWPPAGLRLRLVPRPGVTPASADELIEALARRVAPATAYRAPGADERRLRLLLPDTPRDAASLPQARLVLAQPLPLAAGATAPASLFDLVAEPLRDHVLWQQGRFVVPVEVRPAYEAEQVRLDIRRRWDSQLATLALPPAAELLRPDLGPLAVRWTPEEIRLALFAAGLPLLLLALATARLGRTRLGLATMAPLALGALAAAPLLSGVRGLDDLGLLALLAATAASLGATLVWAAELPFGSAGRVYRAGRRHGFATGAGALLAAAALVAPTLPVGPAATPFAAAWQSPLRLAATVTAVAQGLALLVIPALVVGVRAWRRLAAPAAVAAREPSAWAGLLRPRLEARSLVKLYPAAGSWLGRAPRRGTASAPVRALDRVSFDLEPGIVGLLGPNGAGKTTLLRILTGILGSSRGVVRFAGVPVSVANLAAYRRHIGFLPQGFDAYPGFTAEQFLDYWARERGMRDPVARRREIAGLLALVGLSEHASRRVRDFSGGMRQRVGIARALLGAPPVLVVDEPTTGLDVEARLQFRAALVAIAAERIIVFSTHIASDVEAVAARLLLLHRGRLRFDGAPGDLVARARGRVFETVVDDAELAAVAHRYRVTSRVREPAGVRLRAVAGTGEAIPGAAVEPTLEEAYLAELHR